MRVVFLTGWALSHSPGYRGIVFSTIRAMRQSYVYRLRFFCIDVLCTVFINILLTNNHALCLLATKIKRQQFPATYLLKVTCS